MLIKKLLFLYIYYYLFNDIIIKDIYIIKRKLSIFPFKLGIISHSALLLITKSNKYYVCEYGANKKNYIDFYKINSYDINNKIIIDNKIWIVKKKCKLNREINIYSVYKTMKKYIIDKKYNLLTCNCHIVQTITRKKLEIL